jgi:hypothetical protein
MLRKKKWNVQEKQSLDIGISAFTACKDRNENLYVAIESWINCESIDEIIVLDWSSNDVVEYNHHKVKVYRVEGENNWCLSEAFNLAARLTTRNEICKLDCDYVIDKDFFVNKALVNKRFYRGDEELADNDNDRYINGFLYLRREDFFSVGGYNENITTYGYDDTDIHERLLRAGLNAVSVDASMIKHIEHDDSHRTFLQDVDDSCEVLIEKNKKIASKKPWSRKNVMANFFASETSILRSPTLATSIPPVDIERHKVTIGSWVENGFSVISVNKKEEIETLKEHFPDVCFVQSNKDSKRHFGKNLIYIDEVINALRNCRSEIVGICNADIYIDVNIDFHKNLNTTVADGLCIAQRLDVEEGNKEVFKDGIDLFLFRRTSIDIIPRTEKILGEPGFCLGMPWWDYYIPMCFIKNNKTITIPEIDRGKYIDSSVIFHEKHKQNWSQLSHMYFERKFKEFLTSNYEDFQDGDSHYYISEILANSMRMVI